MPSSSARRSLPVVVDKWFAENTFHAHEFADIRKLVALKERHNLTISLGLPALNEEKTIGTVIKRVKSALVDRVPLIDQMVVIDSSSEDRTAEIATELGVPVHRHADILPELGSFVGKGEALWKSLHVLDGDIVAWIDTDISNIQPRFVYGLLGPLLARAAAPVREGLLPAADPQRRQAAGRGRRPRHRADGAPADQPVLPRAVGHDPAAVGRVRRPPRAARAAAVLHRLRGRDRPAHRHPRPRRAWRRLGQVDLERRIHRNQPLPNLSQMAYVILQGAIRKLEERHRLELLTEVGRGMKLINTGKDHFNLEVREIGDEIRPPMASIPAYVERRRSLKDR